MTADNELNQSGQPINQRLNAARNASRDISELIGVCKGVLADGVVNFEEAAFMLAWLESNDKCKTIWPASVLYETLDIFLEYGALSLDQEASLLDLLAAITGMPVIVETIDETIVLTNSPTSLPVNEPAEGVDFQGLTFCLTGTFSTGSRSVCEGMVKERGGSVQKAPTRITDYLVIGGEGSRDWANASFGRKIEKAVALRDNGQSIYIVSEEFWMESL